MNLIIPYPLIILSCFIGFSDSKWGTIKDLNLENIKMSDLDNNQHNRGQHLFLSVSCRQSSGFENIFHCLSSVWGEDNKYFGLKYRDYC